MGGGFRGFGLPKNFKIFRNPDFGGHICAAGAPDFAPLRAFFAPQAIFLQVMHLYRGIFAPRKRRRRKFLQIMRVYKGIFVPRKRRRRFFFCKICAYTEGFLHLESAAGDFLKHNMRLCRGIFQQKAPQAKIFANHAPIQGDFSI